MGQVAGRQEAGQRQPHHMAHADIEQGHQTHDGPHQTAAHFRQRRVLLLMDVLLHVGRPLRAVAAALHRGDDLLRRHLLRVVVHHHGAQHQVHHRAVDAGQRARRLFHMGRAGRAGHACYHKFFFHHAASLFHQLLQRGHQLVDDRVVPLTDAVRHAGADVGGQQLFAEAVQRRADGGYLNENIGAIGVLLQHVLQSPYLSLDPVQAVGQALLLLVRAVLRLLTMAAIHRAYLLGVYFDGGIIYPCGVFVNAFLSAYTKVP